MGKIVIKKRVSLDFLGEEYKEAYITFKSIPIKDYSDILKQVNDLGNDNIKSVEFALSTLKKQFVEGKFPVNDKLDSIDAEDIGDLNQDAALECFEILTGQKSDPKVLTPSPSPSSMEPTITT